MPKIPSSSFPVLISHLDNSDVERATTLMAEANVLMLQLEASLEPTFEVAKAASQKGLKVILDPAPAYPIPAGCFSIY